MTQVQDGGAAQVATQNPPQAGSAQPQSSPEVGGTEQSKFIQVPIDNIPQRYNRRWGNVVADANNWDKVQQQGGTEVLQYLTENNVNMRELVDYWKSQGLTTAQAEEAAKETAAEPQGDDKPLTVAEYKKLQQELDKEREAKAAASSKKESETKALQAEAKFGGEVLKEAGIAPDSKLCEHASDTWYRCVYSAKVNAIPSWSSKEQREEAIRAGASPAVLQEAKTMFAAAWKDLHNEIVSGAAKRQATLPEGTLESGAGGRARTKPTDEMSPSERRADMAQAIRENRARRGIT